MIYSISMIDPGTGADVGKRGAHSSSLETISELRKLAMYIGRRYRVDAHATKVQAIPIRTDGTPSYLGNIQCFTLNTQVRLLLGGGLDISVPYLYKVSVSDGIPPKVTLTSSYGTVDINRYRFDFATKTVAELIAQTVQKRTGYAGVTKLITDYMMWTTPALIFMDANDGSWKIASLVSLKKDKR